MNIAQRSGRHPGLPPSSGRNCGQAETPAAPRKARYWLWFVAAFLLQLGAWAAWFTIAARNKVQEVPLAGSPARERRDPPAAHAAGHE